MLSPLVGLLRQLVGFLRLLVALFRYPTNDQWLNSREVQPFLQLTALEETLCARPGGHYFYVRVSCGRC